MSSLSLQCPSCGRQNDDLEKQCACGFQDGNSYITELEKKGSDTVKRKSLKNFDKPKNNEPAENILIKEVDSWAFTYSQEENCINLGTPALKAFKLNLTLEDLEEVLEFVYRVTGKQKTIRKLQLSAESLPELIEVINKLSEEKRSKVSIKFDQDELQGIAELINKKLSE